MITNYAVIFVSGFHLLMSQAADRLQGSCMQKNSVKENLA